MLEAESEPPTSTRPSTTPSAFYNSKRWKLTRRRQLFDHPLCQRDGCDELATEVDHVIPIKQGGDRWFFENLQSLCSHHHGQKTRAEQRQEMGVPPANAKEAMN